MAEHAPKAKITTIDRNPEMIEFAKENFAQFDSRKQITLLEGDAVDVLSTLTESYDFVFMDSAKSKYIISGLRSIVVILAFGACSATRGQKTIAVPISRMFLGCMVP